MAAVTQKIACINDLSQLKNLMTEGRTGFLTFVSKQAYLTTVADDETAVVSIVNGVPTVVTPIASGSYVVAAGDTIDHESGIITGITPA